MGAPVELFDLYLWSDSILLGIDRARSETHLHGAMQLTLGIDADLRMGSTKRGIELSERVILVAANQPHWFESDGAVAILWIEPESRACRQLFDAHLSNAPMVALDQAPIESLNHPLQQLRDGTLPDEAAQELRRRLQLAWVAEEKPTPPLHPAVKRAVRHIETLPIAKISLAEVCRVAGASESHLMHLFKESLGMPLRRYLLWQRVRQAFVAISEGANAAETAAIAGFHDSSHLTRVFKQLLDLTPGDLVKLVPGMRVRLLPNTA